MWSQARYRLASRFAITSTGFGVGASLLFLHQADRVHANASIVPPVLQPGDDVILTVEQGRAEIAKLRTQLLAQKEQHKKQMRELLEKEERELFEEHLENAIEQEKQIRIELMQHLDDYTHKVVTHYNLLEQQKRDEMRDRITQEYLELFEMEWGGVKEKLTTAFEKVKAKIDDDWTQLAVKERQARLRTIDELSEEVLSYKNRYVSHASVCEDEQRLHQLSMALLSLEATFEAAIASIKDETAQQGIASQKLLRREFQAMETNAILESFLAASSSNSSSSVSPSATSSSPSSSSSSAAAPHGIWSLLLASTAEKLTLRTHELVPGTNDAAVLSRAGYYADKRQWENVIAELQDVSPALAPVVQSWIELGRRRVAVKQAVGILKAQVGLLLAENADRLAKLEAAAKGTENKQSEQ